MQASLPDDPLVRETMASLGPGAKDATLDDVAAWIRQLEELCGAQNTTSAPASFRTDISGSCLSTFPPSGNELSTAAHTIELQTKTVKGYPALPELHLEKVCSKKRNARGEAKLRLGVESGPVLVLLTITDLHGANRTLRAVTESDNDLIPIKHPATTIEATAVPFTPYQLLEQLRIVEAKVKEQHEERVQPSACLQRPMESYRQAGGMKFTTKRIGRRFLEITFDRETGTTTIKSSGCASPHCNGVNCTAIPITVTRDFSSGETVYTTDGPQTNDDVLPMLKSFLVDPDRHAELSNRAGTLLEKENAIKEKLLTAKPDEKKRLLKELERKSAEYAKLSDFMFRAAETGGWMGASMEELLALIEKAKQKNPVGVEALRCRALATLAEYTKLFEKFESARGETKKNRLRRMLVREQIEFDEAMDEIAVIADDSEREGSKELNDVEQKDGKEPNDASIHLIEALAFVFVLLFVFVWTGHLRIAYHQLS